MVNYSNGKIYKIINDKNEVIYIGSTTEYYLSTRWAKHKLKCPENKMILIEKYSCNSCEELRKREQEIIEEYENLLNIKKAYQSIENFKYLKSIRNKKYREKDLEAYRLKNNLRQNVKVVCDICGEEMNKSSLTRHKKRKHDVKIKYIE